MKDIPGALTEAGVMEVGFRSKTKPLDGRAGAVGAAGGVHPKDHVKEPIFVPRKEGARSTQPLATDRGTRSLASGIEHFKAAYGDPQSLLQSAIKGVGISKNAVKLGTAAAAVFVAEEKLKGIPLGKALKLLSGKLSTLGDVGNSVRGIISTGKFIDDVQQIEKNPALLKNPGFLLNLGYDTAGTVGGAMVDLKYANQFLTSKGVYAGGKVFKLMGSDGKLEGVVKAGEDGVKVFGKDGKVVQEVSGDFSEVKDLADLKDLGVVTDAAKAVSTSALGDFVGKAAPGLGLVFGGLGMASDAKNILKNGFTLHNSLDLASNVLQTVGAAAIFFPPLAPIGGALMLTSAGIQIAELGVKHLPQIEHFASAAAKDAEHLGKVAVKDVAQGAEHLGKAAVKDVAKDAGKVGHAVSSAWHAVTGWL